MPSDGHADEHDESVCQECEDALADGGIVYVKVGETESGETAIGPIEVCESCKEEMT